MSVEIINKASRECEVCGCLFSFDKEDIQKKSTYDIKRVSFHGTRKDFEHTLFIACPVCGEVNILKTQKENGPIEYENE